MLFIAVERRKHPRGPKPTIKEKRAKYAREGIPAKVSTRVVLFRQAQMKRIKGEFDKTKEGKALMGSVNMATRKANALNNGKTIRLGKPETLDPKTRQMLARPENRIKIALSFSTRVDYLKALLKFAGGQKGTYKSHLKFLEKMVFDSENELEAVRRGLSQYEA